MRGNHLRSLTFALPLPSEGEVSPRGQGESLRRCLVVIYTRRMGTGVQAAEERGHGEKGAVHHRTGVGLF